MQLICQPFISLLFSFFLFLQQNLKEQKLKRKKYYSSKYEKRLESAASALTRDSGWANDRKQVVALGCCSRRATSEP